ncbi:hypothetical protein [Prosthecobacter sp.]|uniref:hypothetical protein n=1 Tax=Prosthecobacter sp. TaxID=1965333 RepID=UPI002ABAD562|nr:hypothetical protein [Prosthecobacter sp.]MDZ4404514.1 hypothetical protein [Prosthecobacter sp.]
MVSTSGGGEKQVQKGDSIRAGTVISCGAIAGALLKPLPTLRVIIYPDTKVRFDGAEILSDGGGNVTCSIIAGKALFHIGQDGESGGEDSSTPKIKVTVHTEEGVIVNDMGGSQQRSNDTNPAEKDAKQTGVATWTVQHDEGRTVVAVGEGMSNVSIGKGSSAANGDVGGQIEVPKGSVIWLFNRGGGRIEAELVDTLTGKVTNLTGGPSQGGSDLVEQSKKQLVTPSSSGTSSTLGTPTTQPGTTPTGGPSNPDLSNPQPQLPVVSADTP